ncbi:MAG: hypothetical protein ACRC7H_07310, partial [Plesiomonas shigelloides]
MHPKLVCPLSLRVSSCYHTILMLSIIRAIFDVHHGVLPLTPLTHCLTAASVVTHYLARHSRHTGSTAPANLRVRTAQAIVRPSDCAPLHSKKAENLT